MCDTMAGWNEAVIKERVAKVCKSTLKHPYNKFNIKDSIAALTQHAMAAVTEHSNHIQAL